MYATLHNEAGRSVHTTRDVLPWATGLFGRPKYPPLLRYGGALFADSGHSMDIGGTAFRLYKEVPDHGGPLDQ